MFIENCWYVAAWRKELDDGPIARTILGQRVLMFCDTANAPVALRDRCAHRAIPLSRGEVTGGIVRCAYHGMAFDGSGQCVNIPSQDLIPPTARVKAFPLVERDGLLWIWMSEAAADTTAVPSLPWLSEPAWGSQGTLFTVNCNWRLIVDNLMDLTHLTFVHGRTIGNAATTVGAETKAKRMDDANVQVTRWMMNSAPPPTYVRAGGFAGPVDRWQVINFALPSLVRIDVGATDAGTGARDGNRVGGIGMQNINLITPETTRTSHYFWAQAHDFLPADAAVTATIFEEIRTTFLEDVGIFEAQQQALEIDPSPPQVDLISDLGSVLVRRMIDRALHRGCDGLTSEMQAAE